jgi:hypothetical protein
MKIVIKVKGNDQMIGKLETEFQGMGWDKYLETNEDGDYFIIKGKKFPIKGVADGNYPISLVLPEEVADASVMIKVKNGIATLFDLSVIYNDNFYNEDEL